MPEGNDVDDHRPDEPAPAAEAAQPGPSARERLVAGLRKTGSRGQVTAAVLLAIVGFAAVVQVQSTGRNDDYDGMREEDLAQLLNSLAGASQRAENEIEQLEQARSSLRSDTDFREAALEQARARATVLGILAGTLPAVGPGVVVIVEDPEQSIGIDQMLNGIEELRNAGAEAIEINDSARVVADTALEDGDGGILVDDVQLSPPYTIDAIGAPNTLAEALTFTGGFVQDIEAPDLGGEVTIKQVDSVEVATVRRLPEPEYAEPVEPE